MIFFETLAVAFGMYSAIPVPQPEWNEKNMRYALGAFPLVGVVVGAFWILWMKLVLYFGFGEIFSAAGFVILSPVITGGIHLDGFLDTSDALASYGTPKRRREILADPHTGSFAVIKLVVLFTAFFGVCSVLSLTMREGVMVTFILVLSRCLSGLSLVTFPINKDSSLGKTFSKGAAKKRVRILLLGLALLAGGGLVFLGSLGGGLVILAGLICFWDLWHTAKKKFEGISGDLCGWFLVRSEFFMILVLVLWEVLQR